MTRIFIARSYVPTLRARFAGALPGLCLQTRRIESVPSPRRLAMNGDRRAKVAAAATVVGLAALGGVALGTNHGMTPTLGSPVASTAGGRAPIVTGASGSTATTAATTPSSTAEGRREPIVTRTSTAVAAGGGVAVVDD
jgi:hypothetical protein